MPTHDEMADAVIRGDAARARALAEQVLAQGLDPLLAVECGFSAGITRVGELWEEGEYFLPELLIGAEAMKAAMAILMPAIRERCEQHERLGRLAIGTVQGDLHDIGKTLVATLLSAAGFEVIDLGADVPPDRFVAAAREGCTLIGLSALLTTTLAAQRAVLERLAEEGLRDRVKVLIGGAAADPEWAAEIGADGYGADAMAAVRIAKALTSP